jgi:hypothetical protein
MVDTVREDPLSICPSVALTLSNSLLVADPLHPPKGSSSLRPGSSHAD